MDKDKVKWYNRILNFFVKTGYVYFLITGVIFLLWGKSMDADKYPYLRFLIIKIGESLLVGGMTITFLKYSQFMGIIKNELTEIIYSEKHLKNRSDLYDIWERVSRATFKDKFPKISNKIIEDVQDIYFPTNHISYYADYKQEIHIELIDLERDIVKVKQYTEFVVHPSEKNSTFPFLPTNIITFGEDRSEVTFLLSSFKVNGVSLEPKTEEKTKDKQLSSTIVHELSGSEKYKIQMEIEKTYSLKHDFIIGMMKKFIIHNLRIDVILGSGLDVTFMKVGTLKEFERPNKISNSHKKYEYEGLIYPRQGYILIVSKKA